jgi:hypothetical protein
LAIAAEEINAVAPAVGVCWLGGDHYAKLFYLFGQLDYCHKVCATV